MKQRTSLMHAGHDPSNPDASFGAWLRYERERRKIPIASIAESTKILGSLFEGLENDDLSRWPDGFYRRAFVSAYAQAIGLDPARVVREFLTRYPESDGQPAAPAPDSQAHGAVLRLALADTRPWFQAGALLRTIRQRFAAAGLDAAAIAVLSAAFWFTFDRFWASVGTVACCYYLASILILGNTPGVCAFATKTRRPPDGGWWKSMRKLATRMVNQPAVSWSFEPPPGAEQQSEA